MMTTQYAERLMQFAAAHDVAMLCFDGEAVTVGLVGYDSTTDESSTQYERVTTRGELRDVLGY